MEMNLSLSNGLNVTELNIYQPNKKEKSKYAKPLKAIAKLVINDSLIIFGINIFNNTDETTMTLYPRDMICMHELKTELDYIINTQISKEMK